MIEYSLNLDFVFGSLADPIRRDILRRLLNAQLTISELAKPYDITLAAISKHIKILERSKLITKQRRGKEQIVSIAPHTMAGAAQYFEFYQQLWGSRFDALDQYLKMEQ